MTFNVRSRSIVVALAGILMVSVAASQSNRIFESSYTPWLAMAVPLVALVIGIAVARLPVAARVAAQMIGVLAVTSIALGNAGGNVPGDLFASTGQGISTILSSRWPVPEIPVPIAAVVALVAVASAVVVELALARRFAASVLLPPIALLAILSLLSAEAGPPSPRYLVVIALGSLAILRLTALLHSDLPEHAKGAPQAAERRSLWTVAVLGVTAATVGVVPAMLAGSLPDDDRYDPRDRQQGSSLPLDLVSPLSRLDEWRGRQPEEVVFSSTESTDLTWRLVALTRFDGRTWMPPDDYRTVGRQLQERTDLANEPRQATVTVGSLDANWLPVPDRVLSVSAPVLLDNEAGGLLVREPYQVGASYDLSFEVAKYQPFEVDTADLSDISAARATKPVSVLIDDVEIPPEIDTLATRITQGAETDLARAQRIADFLVTDYKLDTEAPAGHSIGLIDLFLNEVKRGRDEQFVASFALLANAVGLPVRIAVGFTTSEAPGGGTRALSSDVAAWPEVSFEGVGWVPFDPIPEPAPTSGGEGEEIVSPAPIDEGRAPPTSAATTPSTSVADAPKTSLGSATGVIESPLGRLIALVVILVLLALTYVLIVLRIKAARRSRRRRAQTSDGQVVGAFKTSIDTLVDLGAKAPSHRTDRELVLVGRSVIEEGAGELEPLAELATRAVFDGAPPPASDGAEAWENVRLFERQARERVGRLRWLKAKISLRSLRKGLPDSNEPAA